MRKLPHLSYLEGLPLACRFSSPTKCERKPSPLEGSSAQCHVSRPEHPCESPPIAIRPFFLLLPAELRVEPSGRRHQSSHQSEKEKKGEKKKNTAGQGNPPVASPGCSGWSGCFPFCFSSTYRWILPTNRWKPGRLRIYRSRKTRKQVTRDGQPSDRRRSIMRTNEKVASCQTSCGPSCDSIGALPSTEVERIKKKETTAKATGGAEIVVRAV